MYLLVLVCFHFLYLYFENKKNIGHSNRGNKFVGSFFFAVRQIYLQQLSQEELLALSGCGMPLNALVEYFGFFEGIKLAVMGGTSSCAAEDWRFLFNFAEWALIFFSGFLGINVTALIKSYN